MRRIVAVITVLILLISIILMGVCYIHTQPIDKWVEKNFHLNVEDIDIDEFIPNFFLVKTIDSLSIIRVFIIHKGIWGFNASHLLILPMDYFDSNSKETMFCSFKTHYGRMWIEYVIIGDDDIQEVNIGYKRYEIKDFSPKSNLRITYCTGDYTDSTHVLPVEIFK